MDPNAFDPYADAPRLPLEGEVDLRRLVGRPPAVELEIGPGRGWFMLERLEADPEIHILGLEIRRKWATIVDRRLAARGYSQRARVFAEDARNILRRVTPKSVSVVYIHFPDPWWKKRHHKRRVIDDELAEWLVRILIPRGEVFVQTDVQERFEEYLSVFEQQPELVPAQSVGRVAENPYVARSPRERRAIKDGLPIFRLRYRRMG